MRLFNATAFCLLIGVAGWRLQPEAIVPDHGYYLVVFASEADPVAPRNAHTFAAFIKVPDAAAATDDEPGDLEVHTISWLPASLAVAPLRLFPERGKNFNLADTLAWAKESKARITAWGPFQIKQELYDRALKQIDRLNSGKVAYKAIDLRFRGGSASNCIHAVADVDTEKGFLATGTAYGEPASEIVVRHFQRWMIDSEKSHKAIAEQLKLPTDIRFRTLTAAAPAPKQ